MQLVHPVIILHKHLHNSTDQKKHAFPHFALLDQILEGGCEHAGHVGRNGGNALRTRVLQQGHGVQEVFLDVGVELVLEVVRQLGDLLHVVHGRLEDMGVDCEHLLLQGPWYIVELEHSRKFAALCIKLLLEHLGFQSRGQPCTQHIQIQVHREAHDDHCEEARDDAMWVYVRQANSGQQRHHPIERLLVVGQEVVGLADGVDGQRLPPAVQNDAEARQDVDQH
mmetsp:Transcript_20085/g.34561  ORF Transcript_20085/g.34561 Transcript_20085/m.34561 type:complete len:224 (-) Transcript_20085:489-1160(-)